MPKVSVIIPIYGVEKYIACCARSLFEQTLDDIEYIFINDCTQDCSIEVLNEVIREYPERKHQIKIENMPTNCGLPAVRRHGIQLATGDYIIHCDSDDWLDKSMYEILYNKINSEHLDIVSCDYYESVENNFKYKKCDFTSTEDFYSKLISQKIAVSVWNKLIKKDLYYRFNIEYPTHNMGEDYALIVQLAINAKSFGHISKPMYFYRLNPNSISNNSNPKQIANKWIGLNKNILIVYDYLKKSSLYTKYKSEINEIIFKYKDRIIPYITEDKKYRNIWLNSYPDIGFWQEKGIKNKVRYIIIYLRIYPYLHKLKSHKNS